MIRVQFAGILALCCSIFACARPALPQQSITVEQIFHQPKLSARPPDNLSWSPDGERLTYLPDSGELMEVEAATGSQRVLITRDQMRTFTDVPISKRDQEARNRYHQRLYIWAPDSKQLLFDAGGQLWLFDIASGRSREITSTGAGSGDDPQFSPDGKYLSYLRDQNLYRYSFQGAGSILKLTDSGGGAVSNGAVDWLYEEELDARSNYAWSPDSRHLAYLQTNEANVPRYPIEDFIPIHATVMDQPYPQPGDRNPAVRVGVVSGDGGKTTWLEVPIDSGNDYIPRLGWVDSRTVWVETLTRDQKKITVYFADAVTGEAKPVLTEKDDKFLDDSYDLAVLDGNILLTSWQGGHSHIYLYSFNNENPLSSTANLVRQLTSGDWEVSQISAVDVSTHTVYYLSNEGDPRQQHIWAIQFDGTGRHKVSTLGTWHEAVFSPDARVFADTVSSTVTPPVLRLCHIESGCKNLWNAPPSGVHLIAPIALELKAADGATTLYGRLVLPPNKTAPHSVPLILNPYGGPDVQEVTEQWSPQTLLFDQVLAENGFAVLHVDNRGMGGRGRDFAQACFHNFGPVQFSDQMASLDQVLARYPQLDGNRLGWWGWSWGGTFTLYAMTHSGRFRAGVAVAPVTDWRDYDSIYTERYLGEPESDADAYRQDSVVDSAANLAGRLLLAHGTGDDNVHFENSVQFIQRLIAANIPYDLQIYPRETHDIDSAEARTHLYSRILSQFELYLKTGGSDQ